MNLLGNLSNRLFGNVLLPSRVNLVTCVTVPNLSNTFKITCTHVSFPTCFDK